jgi:hypothetical protein
MGPENLSRKVGSYPPTLRNIPEERKISVPISSYTGSSDSAIVIDKLAVTTNMTLFQDDKAGVVCKHASNPHIYQRVAIRKIPKNCNVYI